MAAVTSTAQQVRAAEAARIAGGYPELIRLEAERRASGHDARLVRDPSTGRYSYQASSARR